MKFEDIERFFFLGYTTSDWFFEEIRRKLDIRALDNSFFIIMTVITFEKYKLLSNLLKVTETLLFFTEKKPLILKSSKLNNIFKKFQTFTNCTARQEILFCIKPNIFDKF
jgi:hypothetical protein